MRLSNSEYFKDFKIFYLTWTEFGLNDPFEFGWNDPFTSRFLVSMERLQTGQY